VRAALVDLMTKIERHKWRGFSKGPEDDAETELSHLISDAIDDAREIAGDEETERAIEAATGRATFIEPLLWEPWLNTKHHITGQTKTQHRAALKAFLGWCGSKVTVQEVDRKKAGAYATYLKQPERSGLSGRTAARHTSSLSAFWQWLAAKGLVQEGFNPWKGQGMFKRSKRGVLDSSTRNPWDDESISKVLTNAYTKRYTETFHDLVRLALVTGARLDELCELKRDDAFKQRDGWWIRITEGKTNAAVREVPVHSAAAHIIERRKKGRDTFLFPGLIPGGPDEKRSWHVSKAFGIFSRKWLGITDRRKVFHSFRNTFMQKLEGAGVPSPIIQLVVGQSRARTIGVSARYMQGQDLDLRAVINKLRYSSRVMKLIATHKP
jgi:integrase